MGPLVIISKGETMIAKRYIKTLKIYFILFYRRMKHKYGKEVVMQEDNASWYKAKEVRVFLKIQKIRYILWLL